MLSLLFPLCFFSIVGVLTCLSFCVFSKGKGSGGWNRTNKDGAYSPCGFRCDPCGASPLARDAHPFALALQSYRGRGLSGSRLRLAHFSRCASGRGLDFCYRGCITHLSVGGVSSYLFIVVCYSIVAGQVPSLSGQVHPGASS